MVFQREDKLYWISESQVVRKLNPPIEKPTAESHMFLNSNHNFYNFFLFYQVKCSPHENGLIL